LFGNYYGIVSNWFDLFLYSKGILPLAYLSHFISFYSIFIFDLLLRIPYILYIHVHIGVHIFYCFCFVSRLQGLIFVLSFHSASRVCIFYSFPACIIECLLDLHASCFTLLFVGLLFPVFVSVSKHLNLHAWSPFVLHALHACLLNSVRSFYPLSFYATFTFAVYLAYSRFGHNCFSCISFYRLVFSTRFFVLILLAFVHRLFVF